MCHSLRTAYYIQAYVISLAYSAFAIASLYNDVLLLARSITICSFMLQYIDIYTCDLDSLSYIYCVWMISQHDVIAECIWCNYISILGSLKVTEYLYMHLYTKHYMKGQRPYIYYYIRSKEHMFTITFGTYFSAQM